MKYALKSMILMHISLSILLKNYSAVLHRVYFAVQNVTKVFFFYMSWKLIVHFFQFLRNFGSAQFWRVYVSLCICVYPPYTGDFYQLIKMFVGELFNAFLTNRSAESKERIRPWGEVSHNLQNSVYLFL